MVRRGGHGVVRREGRRSGACLRARVEEPVRKQVDGDEGEDCAEEELGHVTDERERGEEEEELGDEDEEAACARGGAGAEGEEGLREDVAAGEAAGGAREQVREADGDELVVEVQLAAHIHLDGCHVEGGGEGDDDVPATWRHGVVRWEAHGMVRREEEKATSTHMPTHVGSAVGTRSHRT